MVNCVLENSKDRTVGFESTEQKSLEVVDIVLQSFDGFCLVCIVVLVVKRQVADLHLLERKRRRCQLYNNISQFAVA